MTEKDLIKGCLNNDRRSQNELYKRYFPLMSSIAWRYSNDKEEAIHNLNGAFLKVLQALDRYDPQYSLATFIRNILVNHVIDIFRKEKAYKDTIELADYQEKESGVVFNLGAEELEVEDLVTLLNQLPKMTRNIFNLFAIEGYKHCEIAEMMDIAVGTSKWHVAEARKILTELLLDSGYVKKKNESIKSSI